MMMAPEESAAISVDVADSIWEGEDAGRSIDEAAFVE
jgi:hypothetical protein